MPLKYATITTTNTIADASVPLAYSLSFINVCCSCPYLSPPLSCMRRPDTTRSQASNATSWERPVKDGVSGQLANATGTPLGAGGKGKDGGGGAATGKSEGGGGGAPPPLPVGWKEVKDPKTGGVYYWNQVR